MIAFAPWQWLLDALGFVIAEIYDLIPNLGVTIIVLTVLIRLVLLPLGVRQVRSMQHMQVIQPKVKQIQTKYKGNKQRQQEEIMKLYKEYGVNPFSGCWPVLLQFPILIAMYSVIRFPQHPIHIPEDSKLYEQVVTQIPPLEELNVTPEMTPAQLQGLLPEEPPPPTGTSFLGMNLLCSASNAGDENAVLGDQVTAGNGEAVALEYPVDCGETVLDRIPYYAFAVLMFGTTYFQQRQMQKASPPGAASSQQQALLKVMPLVFGVFGIFFPVGLVVYWTTSNAWQIGQQYFMLKNRPTAETLAQRADGRRDPAKKGFMASMMDRAESERQKRGTAPNPPSPPARKPGTAKPGSTPRSSKKPRPGGSSGGDPKKRPKR